MILSWNMPPLLWENIYNEHFRSKLKLLRNAEWNCMCAQRKIREKVEREMEWNGITMWLCIFETYIQIAGDVSEQWNGQKMCSMMNRRVQAYLFLPFIAYFVVYCHSRADEYCDCGAPQTLKYFTVTENNSREFFGVGIWCSWMFWWESYFYCWCLSKLVKSSINSHRCVIKLSTGEWRNCNGDQQQHRQITQNQRTKLSTVLFYFTLHKPKHTHPRIVLKHVFGSFTATGTECISLSLAPVKHCSPVTFPFSLSEMSAYVLWGTILIVTNI